MRKSTYFIIGALACNVFYSCAMGSKSIDFNDFPIRSKENTIYTKCKDGDIVNVCKYECTKYKKKNICKKGHEKVTKINITNSLNNGFVVVNTAWIINLLRNQK